MKKILIIAAKLYNDPTGGGGTVLKTLIDTLIDDYQLDLILYRTPVKDYYQHPQLKTYFHPIKFRSLNKFERRIKNIEWNMQYLNDNHDLYSYEKIIIVHISKLFGFEILSKDILAKTIIFPMYLTPSYKRSNEVVSDAYFDAEKRVLGLVGKIITPSLSEKEDLLQFYQVDESKIKVIPRGIDNVFLNEQRLGFHFPIKLITVSSIKPQKNVLESIKILKTLRSLGHNVVLSIIGKVEVQHLYEELISCIDSTEMSPYVDVIQGLPLDLVAEEMHKADLLVLPSRWETFGRVVYEGLASGMPAVIKDNIDCFSHLYKQQFIAPYDTVNEAVKKIAYWIDHLDEYKEASKLAIDFSIQFLSELERKRLYEEITC